MVPLPSDISMVFSIQGQRGGRNPARRKAQDTALRQAHLSGLNKLFSEGETPLAGTAPVRTSDLGNAVVLYPLPGGLH